MLNNQIADIGGNNSTGPAARLSNFTERHFVFDGVECASLEGVLQSFKFKELEKQREVCALIGIKAKKAGMQTDWRPAQTLYWNGEEYPRDSVDYQQLLDRLYTEVYNQNSSFISDLYATGAQKLIHSLGKSDPSETILTEREFCDRLEKLRNCLMEAFHGAYGQ